jgi:D-tagatose-1,6-bisphosphate aldolase subunit GatZ/KbaZ
MVKIDSVPSPNTRKRFYEKMPFNKLISAQRAGQSVGIYSICSAHPYVLEAAMLQAKADATHLLIEATSNQVNQFGGYTGMTPSQFITYVREIAERVQFEAPRIILGGDHLGPHVWQKLPAEEAMSHARALVQAYIEAGFRKIHLDTSMPCADDSRPLAEEVVAMRAAELCRAAQEALPSKDPTAAPVYVIGTEVPVPGGAQEELEQLEPTSTEAAERTIEVTHQAFVSQQLEQEWERVIALVVQPGVEFGDTEVVDYIPENARGLTRLIEDYDGLVYEAHSTDYQSEDALRALVRDHFAILKVGPGLTFAFREAVYSLACIEDELAAANPEIEVSRIRRVLDEAMVEKPEHWQKHYPGNSAQQALARAFSYSDRSRYYWPQPKVQKAFQQLLENLSNSPLPLSLLSQFMPRQYERVRSGAISDDSRVLILDKIMEVTGTYSRACSSYSSSP